MWETFAFNHSYLYKGLSTSPSHGFHLTMRQRVGHHFYRRPLHNSHAKLWPQLGLAVPRIDRAVFQIEPGIEQGIAPDRPCALLGGQRMQRERAGSRPGVFPVPESGAKERPYRGCSGSDDSNGGF